MKPNSVLWTSRTSVRTTTARGGFWATVIRFIELIRKWLPRWLQWLLELIGIPFWRRLGFVMQLQQQTQWCWSAVAVSVAAFYNPSTTWVQCTVVNAELNQTTCCANGGSANCNQPWFLDSALQRVDRLQSWSSGTQTFTAVRNEINASRPLGVRIGWNGGGGHFVIVEGYFPGSPQRVSVHDPWTGTADIDYTTLVSNYQSTGTWTHSYFTLA